MKKIIFILAIAIICLLFFALIILSRFSSLGFVTIEDKPILIDRSFKCSYYDTNQKKTVYYNCSRCKLSGQPWKLKVRVLGVDKKPEVGVEVVITTSEKHMEKECLVDKALTNSNGEVEFFLPERKPLENSYLPEYVITVNDKTIPVSTLPFIKGLYLDKDTEIELPLFLKGPGF